MEKKLVATQFIALGLVLALIIAAFVIWNQHQAIVALKAPAAQNITMQRDIIREDCSKSDADSIARCADDLQSLSDLLAQFSKTRTAGTPVPVKATVTGSSGVHSSNIQVITVPAK